MGTCTSTPRLQPTLTFRSFLTSSRPNDGLGEDWYFDTMNLLLDRWAPSHIQFLRKKFLEATGEGEEELDKKGFYSLFAELQDMPDSVSQSAFRMFDTDGSGKLNFKEFCCALALCCQLMSSDDEKIRFVFDMFDTNDDGLLSALEVQQLVEHSLREEEKYLPADEHLRQEAQLRSRSRISKLKQELLGSTSQPLSFDRFYEWAQRNMDSLNNLLCTFQLVPAPQRERAVCEDIMLRNPVLQEGCTWYCISHKWLQVWKSYTGWTQPTRRRVTGHAVESVGRDRERCHSGDSGVSLPFFGTNGVISHEDRWDRALGSSLPARPPEIDNSDLEGEHKGELKMNLVEHLDFELIPEEMWLRLVEWYGGGPALPRTVICMGRDRQMQVELYPALVLVVVAGDDGKPLPQFSRRFFISKQSTLDQTLLMLAEKLSKPMDRSRLWHRSKGEQWRLVPNPLLTMDEFLEGKGWDAGAFLLETMKDGEWPRDRDTEVEDAPTEEAELGFQGFEVGDRVEAKAAGTGQWLRGTIVDVVLRQTSTSSTPSQVKVHFDSTVYKSDEWINTQRLALLGTHTVDPKDRESESPTSGVPGATGLQNLGNTCFMNATLQCMVNTPLLREYFLCSQHLAESKERARSSSLKGKFAQEFGSVLLELWSGKGSVVSPNNLKRTIDQFAPQFAGYEQHDAQEFLDFVLEALHEDLNRGGPRSLSSKGSSRTNSKSRLRKEQSTPKLFSAKPLLTRGSRESTPRRVKAVWKERGEEETGSYGDGALSSDEMAVASMELSEEIVVPPPPESPWGTLVGVAGLPGGQENWSIGAFFRAEVADAKGADPPVEEATLPEAEHHDQSSIYEEEVATLCPDSLDPKPEEGLVPSELKGEGSEVAPPQSEDAEDYSVPPEAPPSKPNKAATRGPSGKRARWWSFAWRRDGRALDLPGKDGEGDSPPKEGPGESPQAEEIGEEMSRLKMPSGSAAAVVAARRSEDVNYVQQGVQESEDFVPELLTPQPSRRGRSLFGWRRKREEDLPGTPGRRTKTPGTMTTLREEEASEERRPGSAEVSQDPVGSRSFLPWRGGTTPSTPRERTEQDEAPRIAEGGRGKDKDSILPTFFRRSSRERSRVPRHAGDSPPTDCAATSPSEGQGTEACPSPSEDASSKAASASSSLPFFFRAPWSAKRETSLSSPGNKEEGDLATLALPGTTDGQEAEPTMSPTSDAPHAESEVEEGKPSEDDLPDEEKAALVWERYRAQNRSLIGDLFEGQLRSQLRCSCGHNSSTFEPFRYLSIPIPSNHMDRCELKVIYFPALSSPTDRPQLVRYTVQVPKSSTAKRLQLTLARQLPVSSVLLAEVYRSRIHRYLEPNLPLSDVRDEDQLVAFEVQQNPEDLVAFQQQVLSKNLTQEPLGTVLMIQVMHRHVVDVCRPDGDTWAQKREVFGMPFVMSAGSTWTYAALHEMLMIHARRYLKAGHGSDSQVPFVARIVNASGTACGACDRKNCTGCLLPKGQARLRLRAGLFTSGTAKIYVALDWVDSSMYDQGYVDSIREDSAEATVEETADAEAKLVPLAACINAFAEAEALKMDENGNGVKCDKCKVCVDATKQIDIWREPDVLVLHIKRFHFSGEHFEKISTPVQVPLTELDVRSWIGGPTGSCTAYDLYGVACHRGGMSGGHYTSYCMNEGGKEPQWLKFNDDTVSVVDLEQELPEISKQCYVLFYRKQALSSSNLINYSSL
ncbi:unnamed protein product [Durusdinium trenchii]|uniref:ubiquitinyl hydrolase 1 n=1 Tax=Durusdinium trenchii TaxID=1381693 RepID=A0ABP0SPU5_9DINO